MRDYVKACLTVKRTSHMRGQEPHSTGKNSWKVMWHASHCTILNYDATYQRLMNNIIHIQNVKPSILMTPPSEEKIGSNIFKFVWVIYNIKGYDRRPNPMKCIFGMSMRNLWNIWWILKEFKLMLTTCWEASWTKLFHLKSKKWLLHFLRHLWNKTRSTCHTL